ncbi:MAG: flagellar motor switch protein FliM [Deltaproteobacteria bacterium]|nr:flagellar motor switch protein FliM [Deltaproteobacteria bacterium]
MNNLLSKDEVETLLKGMDAGEIETEMKKGPSEVQAFDFSSHERVIRGRMPGLEMACERFSRIFRNSLSGILMKFVDINIEGHELIKFGEFMRTLPHPSSINIFKMEPLKGLALMVIEAPMVFALVDQILGGSSKPWVQSDGRYFTPIEQKITRKIVDTALKDLALAWQGIFSMEPQYVNSEMNPQFVTIDVTHSESVIRIEVKIEIEDFSGKIFFCIPYSLIEPIKDKLFSGIRSQTQGVDQRWISRLKDILKESFVDLEVDLGYAELSLRELGQIEKGNVITLETSVSDELIIRVEGVPKMKGIAGSYRGNQGVKITKFLENN